MSRYEKAYANQNLIHIYSIVKVSSLGLCCRKDFSNISRFMNFLRWTNHSFTVYILRAVDEVV